MVAVTAEASLWPACPLPVPEGLGDERIGLRPWRADDAPALVEAWADPEIRARLDPPPADLTIARDWIAGVSSRLESGAALDLVVDVGGAVVGEVGLHGFDPRRRAALLGYWIGPSYRGMGLAARAVRLLTTWVLGCDLGARAVLVECDVANEASWRTAERAGYRLLSADHRGRRVYVARPGVGDVAG